MKFGYARVSTSGQHTRFADVATLSSERCDTIEVVQGVAALENLVRYPPREVDEMIDFVIETEIARSPIDAFAFVTDATNLAKWQTNTVSAVPEPAGPIGLGTRIREVHRAGGIQFAELVEVVEYEPDRVFGMRIIEGVPVHGRITFEPSDTGTRFRLRVCSQQTGMMRIAQPILRAMLKRQFDQHCTNLKTVLETQREP